jgi:ATP-binding cassette, subfamily F, member 3
MKGSADEKFYFCSKFVFMISFDNVCLQYSDRKLFNEISFMVNPNDRIGLVGKNGAGKSTLIKAIMKKVNIDSGNITMPKDIRIGYLPQEIYCKDTRTVLNEAMSAFSDIYQLEKEIEHLNRELAARNDYESDSYMDLAEMIAEKTERLHLNNTSTIEANSVKTLKGLGFREKDHKRPTSEFSGGWRMRVEIAKILLQSPDIFLLDEPTNHLDIESIQWLENFLKQYHGAVILISHDRAFLDQVTTRTLEITLGQIYDYKVPYSKYIELRKERRQQQLAAYRNQQKQIEDTKVFIERFRYKNTKAVQVQSRIKQLEKLDIIEIEDEDNSSVNISFPPAPRSGSIVFKAENLTKSFGEHTVLKDIDLVVERGEKIAFVGRNGEGKTTLSRIIMGELEFSGSTHLGHNVKIGYYAQNQDELLQPDLTVLETIDNVAVGDIRTKIRDILGAFLFSGEDVDKKVKILSGGEKSRLALARLLLEPYNVLVLDEPTNHLDMHSKDILKQALLNYNGTLILVSHDREFLDGLTNKIYEFRDKKIREHRDNIYDFLKKKKIENLSQLDIKDKKKKILETKTETAVQKQLYQERKELDREIRKVINLIELLEREIGSAESGIREMDKKMSEGNSNFNQEFYQKYDKQKKVIEEGMPEWEKLQNVLEGLRRKRKSVI